MVTAHVYPFDTVKADPRYDSSPVVAHGATTPDERPGDYLEHNDAPGFISNYSLCKPHVTRDRYPTPDQADLVTMWRKDGRAVLSVTSAGKVNDYFVAPNVVALLARESIELLSHSTNLKG